MVDHLIGLVPVVMVGQGCGLISSLQVKPDTLTFPAPPLHKQYLEVLLVIFPNRSQNNVSTGVTCLLRYFYL